MWVGSRDTVQWVLASICVVGGPIVITVDTHGLTCTYMRHTHVALPMCMQSHKGVYTHTLCSIVWMRMNVCFVIVKHTFTVTLLV